jgi:hypothetical protein
MNSKRDYSKENSSTTSTACQNIGDSDGHTSKSKDMEGYRTFRAGGRPVLDVEGEGEQYCGEEGNGTTLSSKNWSTLTAKECKIQSEIQLRFFLCSFPDFLLKIKGPALFY